MKHLEKSFNAHKKCHWLLKSGGLPQIIDHKNGYNFIDFTDTEQTIDVVVAESHPQNI